jgi:hypothetical protein
VIIETKSELHYRGDRREAVENGQVFGLPDMFGAFYVPTGGVYDPEADRTTIMFRPLPPAELAEIMGMPR